MNIDILLVNLIKPEQSEHLNFDLTSDVIKDLQVNLCTLVEESTYGSIVWRLIGAVVWEITGVRCGGVPPPPLPQQNV